MSAVHTECYDACTCACITYVHNDLQALGNDLQVTKSGVEEFLPAATVMVVSVTASTTQGLALMIVTLL